MSSKIMAATCQAISVVFFLGAVFMKEYTAAGIFWLAAAVWRNVHG